MGRKKYATVSDALKDIPLGQTKHVMINKNLVTLRKGVEDYPKGLTANLYTPIKKAKVITK